MSENETAGAIIDLNEARKLVKAFQDQNPNSIKAYTIDVALLKTLINQEHCTQIRIYNGYDEMQNRITPVLIGVDENNKDLKNGVVLDRFHTCPPAAIEFSFLED